MKIERDKVYHFLVSMFLVFGVYALTKNIHISVIVTFLIGIWKEIVDKIKGRTDCLEDMIANACGMIVGVIMILV